MMGGSDRAFSRQAARKIAPYGRAEQSRGEKVKTMLENIVQVKAPVGSRTLPRPFARAGGEPISKNERKVTGYALVPLDGSALGERVIPHALALAETMGYGLKLLRVMQPPH